MRFGANFKIETDCSIVSDGKVLRVNHPRRLYRARIKNIPRSEYTVPFLLSLHIYFDAPSMEQAKEVADEHLADCLNMLALTTGAKYRRHSTKSIVDIAGAKPNGMTRVHLWSDSIEYEDPQPFLEDKTTQAIERLLEFEIPSALRRAMRWYRLGINESVPDDQFMYFWLALEIVAEFQKSTEKVPDKCPHCQSPLYCESCDTYPVHKQFNKQAIRSLLTSIDKECSDETLIRLEKTRNSLAHGKTLKEIESSLPDPHKEIVDILGRLVWKSLLFQFPHEMFDGALSLGMPSTYIKRKVSTVAILETVLQKLSDGDLDLDFKGMTAYEEPFGPPQSARPTVLKLTQTQFEKLTNLVFTKGDHQEVCQRIYDKTKPANDGVICMILATDVTEIKQAISSGKKDDWLELFCEILPEV